MLQSGTSLLLLAAALGLAVAGKQQIFGYENPENNLIENWNHDKKPDGKTVIVKGATVVVDKKVRFIKPSSFKITDRKSNTGGITHNLVQDTTTTPLKKNTNYYASCHIKLESNNPDGDYAWAQLKYSILVKASANAKPKSMYGTKIGEIPFMRMTKEWQQFGGTFKTPDEVFYATQLFIDVSPASVNYWLDACTLIELTPHEDWRQHYQDKIDIVRKSNINLQVKLSKGFKKGKTTVEVSHVRHEFGFGLSLKALQFNKNNKYKQFFLDHFNSAGMENDYKWRTMEKIRGKPVFTHLDKANKVLGNHSVSCRAQAILWNREENLPDWVPLLNSTELKKAIYERVEYFMNHFKTKLTEVDVQNEYLHHRYMETRLGELDLLDDVMKKAHQLAPKMRLCVNDYEIIRNSRKTSSLVNLMKRYKDKYPVCIGIQGHLREYQLPIDPEIMEKRLDIVCSAGIPASVTEFSVHSTNEMTKKDQLEKALMALFSSPCVSNIVISGYSDLTELQFTPESCLFKGADFKPNAAGSCLLNYIDTIWRTNESFNPAKASSTVSFSAYHGTYNVVAKTNGVEIGSGSFTVKKDGPTSFSVKL